MQRDVLEFVRGLQTMYLEQRDMDKVLDVIGEQTSWIGTGRHEICKSFSEAEKALLAEKREYQGGFTVTDSWYETEPIPQNACVVYGEYWAKPRDVTADMASLHHRVSAVCIKTAEGIKLLHLHMSSPDDDQVDEEYYVKEHKKMDKQTLQIRMEQATKNLNVSNRKMEILTSNIPGGVHQTKNDEGLTLLSMSNGFLTMFGYSEADIAERFQNRFMDMIYQPDRENFVKEAVKQLKHGQTVEFEYRVPCKNGELMWVFDRGRLVMGDDGTESYFCMMMDITERKEEQERSRLMLERHKVIMDQTSDIIFEWDMVQDTIDFSSNWEKKFGYMPISKDISKEIPTSENIHPEDMNIFVKLMKEVRLGAPYVETEFRIRSVQKEYVWCRVRATAQFDSAHNPIKAVGVIIDIDEEKNRNDVLVEAAQRDALTKLYNKNATKAKIEHFIGKISNDRVHALMIIDVDNFKTVNDRFGHQCGDAVLLNMAQALKKLFRATDIIGRIGGDEFLVFMPNVSNVELIKEKAREIVKIFDTMPEEIGADISCSVGVACYPKDATDYFGLSRCADNALYEVKNHGKENFIFYEKDMQNSVPEVLMRTAIVGREEVEQSNAVSQELLQHVFQLLYETTDMKTSIKHILASVGRAFDVSRVYVFEASEDGRFCSNTFEWCNVGVKPEQENLQNLSFETDLNGFFDLYDESGVFYCQDIKTLKSNLHAVLEAQGIVSVLQCFINDDGRFRGYVGFDECRENRYWTSEQIHTLTLVANILSTFLIKQRLKEQIEMLKKV